MTGDHTPTARELHEAAEGQSEGLQLTHLDRTIQKAMFPHKCTLCGTHITPGQIYVRVVYLLEGQVQVLKYHEPRKDGDECRWGRLGP